MTGPLDTLKAKALDEIEKALVYLNTSLKKFPEDDVFGTYKELLTEIQQSIKVQWPPSLADTKTESLAAWTARNMDTYAELDRRIGDLFWDVKLAKNYKTSQFWIRRTLPLLEKLVKENPADASLKHLQAETQFLRDAVQKTWPPSVDIGKRAAAFLDFVEKQYAESNFPLAARLARYAFAIDEISESEPADLK